MTVAQNRQDSTAGGRDMAKNPFSEAEADSIPVLKPPPVFSYPFLVHPSRLFYIPLGEEQTVVIRDSLGFYRSQRFIHDIPVAVPYVMDFDDYAARSKQRSMRENWKSLSAELEAQQTQDRGLLDFRIDVPGGTQSTFTTIFGKPEVNLRVNGTANLNVGAAIQNVENPNIPPDQQTQVDPTFDQSLKLNIQGTIGDKLSIRTDWDTERAFDFQNRINILYQGYEDEVLKRLEMGNVAMETGNSLIRGGNALFGVKSVAQLGSLRFTSVLSQQEGQGITQTITGGAQEQQISIQPADYEYDRHYFLDFFTRQEFETNMSNPQQLGQALQLSEIRVWILRESTQSFEGERQAIALVDLGIVENPDGSFSPPDDEQDIFTDATLDQFRDPAVGVSAGDFGVDPSEFVEGLFIPLQEGVDYELNRPLGYISLKRNLGSRQALAVSFKYLDPQTGENVSVGELSQGGGSRIYLKLIRPQNITTTNKAWDLMLKNIYSLNSSNITQDGLEVNISYTEPNVPQNTLPERNSILLQDLGLDRVDTQGGLNPDNKIDFSTGTLDPVSGRIIFPYLEPFGDRIRELLSETALGQQEVDRLVFDELYNQKKVNAEQVSKNNFYLVEGTSKGTVSNNYSLGLSLVEGSVRVFANGKELQEGTDFIVDYSIGNITILNEQYLAKGQEIRIEYENNQLAQIERKTFTGMRAEYQISEDIQLGSTYFKLKERPLQDKIRIGDEPINNSAIGFDANAYFDLPWLTRAVDKVPLLQTKEPSSISFSGEFARLQPGVSQTNAISDAIDNNELFEDEENGLVFIDDFEGSDISLSFMNPLRWSLSTAPAAVPGYGPDQIFFEDNPPPDPSSAISDKIARSDLRAQFSWYSIPQNIDDILGSVDRTPESRLVRVTDVFPNRDVLSEENFITTLDVYYDPRERGPYNYNPDLRNVIENERDRLWGGMTATLPSGQEDLTQNNIEFLEFWVQSVLPGGSEPTAADLADYEGKIFIDIGIISEDVVPNFKLNSEDGLSRRPENLQVDNLGGDPRSYIPVPAPPPEGQFTNENRSLEDVGLDGAPNTGGIDNKNETELFSSFLSQMQASFGAGSSAFEQIQADPSNDDYAFYAEDKLNGLPLHERFHRLHGYHDGNSPQNQGDKQAVTNIPDAEGLITPSIVEQNNAYFQYEIDWNPADFDRLDVGEPGTFIVDKVPGANQEDRWYQVRIPLEDFVRKVGNIDNFQNISYIRVWLSGYEQPFTLRFATFEFVGSQWRFAENVNRLQNIQENLNISSVNIEENSRRTPIPYRLPEGVIRSKNRAQQRQTVANEQSLVLQVDDLGAGELQMIKRVYPGGLNMVNYSNLRMFVHGEGYQNREDLELVMRFGTDLTNNYYEYRQPVTPSDPNFPFSDKPLTELTDAERTEESRQVWLNEENSMNILLRKFNELKQLRDQQDNVDINELFERSDLLQNAAPGAVLAIKGNPSLDRIGEIGMGILNPFDPDNPDRGVPSLDAELWLNELRVSGFDNRKGWAANGKAELQLADFASVNANFNRQTDGFGSLDSRLGQRRISDVLAYDVSSTVNLHKFIPDRYGWNIPVTLSARQSTSTPRYLPNQGDVRIDEFKEAVRARDDITEIEKQNLIDQRVKASQTYSESYSINFSNVTKRNSSSAFAKYTLDKTNINFVYNLTDRRNPEFQLNNNWNFNGSIRYDVNFQRTHLFAPFWFLGNVPLLSPIAGFKLGYTPSSINASAGVDRSYEERKRRLVAGQPEIPLQQTHIFNYNTNFGFSYNLMPSVRTSFQSRTTFDLSTEGIEQRFNPGEVDSVTFKTRPTFEVFEDLIFDTLSSRRSNYEEAYSAGWQPRLNRVDALSWVNYSANYGGGFQWRNSPRQSGLGANISNNLSLTQNLNLNIRDLLNRMAWFRSLQNNGRNNGRTQADTDTTGQGYSDKDFGSDIAFVAKKGLLAILSLESIDISFTNSKRAQQTGYAGESQIFKMFEQGGADFSPPFSYRTGITHDIGRNQLIDNPNIDQTIQLPGNKNFNDDLTVGTRLIPFKNFSIDLTWNSRWNEVNTETITVDPDQTTSTVRTQSGNISSSVWSFGTGYEDLFKTQLQRAFDDIVSGSDSLSDNTGNRDGATVLGKESLQEDFREAYLGPTTGVLGKRNFIPFPLPGWRVTWSGVDKIIPFLGNLMTRATVNHGYTGRYRLGWVFNIDQSPLPPNSLGSFTVIDNRPEFEPTSITIEKNFDPLVGVNITWLSNLRTSVQYNWSQISSLALSNTIVTERLSKGVKFSINYTIRDFKIPLFPRIRNAVDFTINGSIIEDLEKKFVLNSDLSNALQGDSDTIVKDPDLYSFSESFRGGQTRFNGSAVVGYQFSQMIKANLEYSYRRLIPKSSGVFERTDHNILFNIVVSIRSG